MHFLLIKDGPKLSASIAEQLQEESIAIDVAASMEEKVKSLRMSMNTMPSCWILYFRIRMVGQPA
jgi:DNA-binding response OmpR family regulator